MTPIAPLGDWCWKCPCSAVETDYVADKRGISTICLARRFDWISLKTYQNGFRMARHGGLHTTGSYGNGSYPARSFSGVYMHPIGTTILLASSRDDGHTFQDKRTPSLSSISSKVDICCAAVTISTLVYISETRTK